MRVFAITAVMLVSLGSTLSPALGRQKLDLRLRFLKGDSHQMNVKLDQTIDQTVQGRKTETKQVIGIVYTFSVEDVNPQGVATISVHYDAVSFHAKTPDGPVDYDSAQPPGQVPPMAGGLAALIGQGYSLKTSPEGKVIEVSGLEKLLNGVLAKLNVPEGPARSAAEKVLRQQINEQNMRSNLQNIFAPFPDGPVSIGQSWSRKNRISLGFPLDIQTTYTLHGRKNGIATVDLSGSSSTAANAMVDLGQMKMNYELHGTLKGSLEIIESNGWTRSAQTLQNLTGSATIHVPNALPQIVPITIESTMTTAQK